MTTQTAFTKKGLSMLPDGVTREDQILRVEMQRKKVICPYCLYYGTLWEFHTRLKNKRGKHFISISKNKCPYCNHGFTKKTLLEVAALSMEEFAEWFWKRMFEGWGFGDEVDFDAFMKRLKAHYSYSNRQIFWDVYWEHKDASPGGEKTREDQGAYDDYQKTMEKETKEDFEDYKKAFEAPQSKKENQIPTPPGEEKE